MSEMPPAVVRESTTSTRAPSICCAAVFATECVTDASAMSVITRIERKPSRVSVWYTSRHSPRDGAEVDGLVFDEASFA
jgi:hypothetical protein